MVYMGLFGELFDFDHDGKMSTMEDAAGFSIFADIMDEDKTNKKKEDLELRGLDEDERKEALEDAGLDPEDYDFE